MVHSARPQSSSGEAYTAVWPEAARARDDDGVLAFWPRRAPEDNAILRFPLIYRGRMLEIEIAHDKVEYALRDGERLGIRHESEDIELTPDNPVAVRPVSGW
jgi:alpha,alpha-trehalose phosphorylase